MAFDASNVRAIAEEVRGQDNWPRDIRLKVSRSRPGCWSVTIYDGDEWHAQVATLGLGKALEVAMSYVASICDGGHPWPEILHDTRP